MNQEKQKNSTTEDKLPISSSDCESFVQATREYLNGVQIEDANPVLTLNTICDPLKSLGTDIQKTIEGLQTQNQELANKLVWYESILDSIPFPVSVTDLNLNWTFLNSSVERVAGITRKEGIGKPCSTWNTHICKTDKCTMQLFQKGVNNTLFEQDGRVYRIECANITDANGNNTGIMETLIDVTAMQKTLQYLEQSVSMISDDLGKIAEGNTNFSSKVLDADTDTKEVREKFVVISNSVESVRIAIENLVHDSNMLSKSAIDGILDTRADASKHKGDFQKVIKGVNDTLDAVIGPLNVAAEYVDRISKGDIPPKITDPFYGDFNEIKNNLNTCIDSLNMLVSDANTVYEKQKSGDIEANIDNTRYQGVYKTIIEGYNNAINLHVKNILTILTILTSYAEGNFTPVLQKLPGKQVIANEKMDLLRGNLLALIDDTNTLTRAATEGELSTRADATKHQGDFRKIVTGINATLDAVIGPLNMAAEYVDRISKGEIPSQITDSYSGDFNEIKNNLNQCIQGLGGLVECNDTMERLVVNDHTRRVESQYPGIFGSMGKATNLVRERLIAATTLTNDIATGNTSRLPELKKIGKRSDQDLLMPAFIHCMENVQRLIEETNMLSQAAVEGRLATRANAANHEGDFKKIIEGINLTFDSVVIPVTEALRVSKEYSQYQFRTRVNPSINIAGDWMEFKNALDNIGIQVSEAVGLINRQFVDLASNAEEATASIEEVSAGAQQIAHSSVGVSKNAELGNDGIIQVLKAMEDLTVTVGEVSQRAEQVSSSAVQANEFSKLGINLAKKSEASMVEMTRSSSEVDLIINEINTQMADIGKIIRLISDIANQTNLLALNAAIEAARAGEAGRGFAVVAAEVKSLAQDSRKSAENIADMISTLQDKAQKATTAMAYAGKTVIEGSKSLTETLDAFNKIASSIDDITRNAMDVAAASEEQAASVEEVTASIHEVSGLLVNTASEAGNTAGATEEVSASIEQISKVVSNVSGIADSVSREMSKFVV